MYNNLYNSGLDCSDSVSSKKKDLEISDSTSESFKVHRLYGNDVKQLCPKKLGNVTVIYYWNEEPILVIGPQFKLTILLACMIFIITTILFTTVYHHLNIIYHFVGIILYLIQVTSQLYTAMINPGILNRNYYFTKELFPELEKSVNLNFCEFCSILVKESQNVNHCETCEICFEGFDHHCIWIGKCIAKRNLLSFWVFVFSTIIYFLYNIVIFFIFILFRYLKL